MAEDAATVATWSVQRRLRRQLLALLSGCWLLASAAAGWVLWHETNRALDSAMAETAEHLLMLPVSAYPTHDAVHRQMPRNIPTDDLVYQLIDAQGLVQLRSQQAPLTALAPGAPDGLRRQGGWRVLTQHSADGQRLVQVAEPSGHRRTVLWTSGGWLLAVLLALLPVAALGMGWMLRQAFRSLEPARRELASRALHDLSPVHSDDAPAELQPWLQTVNALLARVQALVHSERSFAANTAHELRTPLAAAMAQAQRLVATSADAQHRAAAQALLRQLERLTRLATRLLQLARIESGVALQRAPVDLVALTLLVADDFGEAQRSGRLQIQVHQQPLPVQGDIDALGIALRNLIDNALKHGGDEATVTVHIAGDSLRVADDGPGVPPDQLGGLVRQFSRASSGVTAGSGLGLAMVDTIARQSGARLLLQSPDADAAPGRPGFSATLDFSATR